VARITVPEGTYSVVPGSTVKVVHCTSVVIGVPAREATTELVQLVLAEMVQTPVVVVLDPSP
jgi:hypothetical protein